MQRDVVLRWIEEIARVVRRLLHGPGEVDLDQATAVLEDAVAHLLGPLTALASRLDPASAAELLHDPHRIYGYSRLLALQAAIEAARGRPEAAAMTSARATALAGAARQRDPDLPD